MHENYLDIEKAQRAYGDSVRRFRSRIALSQEDLALKAGINRTHMYKLEAGLVNPTLFTTLRLCVVLGIAYKRFAGEVEKNLTRGNHRRR
jgi:DNA-binding XRE family transcriptional regulator